MLDGRNEDFMDRSPERTPPRPKKPMIELALPMAPRLSLSSQQSSCSGAGSADGSAIDGLRAALHGAPIASEVRLQSPSSSSCLFMRKPSSSALDADGDLGMVGSQGSRPWRASRRPSAELDGFRPGAELESLRFLEAPNPAQLAGFSKDVTGSLVANELAQIYELVKAKSERVVEKERQLHRSECLVAETVGIAQVQLRAIAEELLRSSQRELKKEAAQQHRRLEELFKKAQEEFRKAIAWRKEARAMKGAAESELGSHEKLQKKVQELQKRCNVLSEREKALRKEHAREKEQWDEERQYLMEQQEQLQYQLQQLQQDLQLQQTLHLQQLQQEHELSWPGRSAPRSWQTAWDESTHDLLAPSPQRTRARSRPEAWAHPAGYDGSEASWPSAGRRWQRPRVHAAEAETDASADVEEYMVEPPELTRSQYSVDSRWHEASHHVPRHLRDVQPEKPLLMALLAAWWGLDAVAALGHRGLWGCAVLLANEPLGSAGDPRSLLQDLRGCFLRRWVWRALVNDAAGAWSVAAKAPGLGSADNNALAWARQCMERSGSRKDARQVPEVDTELLGFEPFDLQDWLPEPGSGGAGPLSELQQYLVSLLAPKLGDGGVLQHTSDLLLWLRPASAQEKLAAVVWNDVRRQLLASEEALRQGQAEPSALAEVGRSLLAVAALSLSTNPSDAQAALRALLRLCTGHSEELRSRLVDALPLILWLVDVTGATGRFSQHAWAADTAELAAALLPELGFNSMGRPAAAARLAATALLRARPEARAVHRTAQPLAVLAQMLCKYAEAVTDLAEDPSEAEEAQVDRRRLRALRAPLRRCLESLRSAGDGDTDSQGPAAAWLVRSLQLLDGLPFA